MGFGIVDAAMCTSYLLFALSLRFAAAAATAAVVDRGGDEIYLSYFHSREAHRRRRNTIK